ncbi:hypothetical protein D9M69_736670 [compost metagenome]
MLERNPALNSLFAAYPSQTVHWPEPNMPMDPGPLALRATLNFSSMMSNAWSQLIGWNSPCLSYLPSFMRSSGSVRRSLPYMIFDRK